MAEQTQTPVATEPAAGTSTAERIPMGSSSELTDTTIKVDGEKDSGKTGPSDEGDGTGAGEERQRPGRAERRISELTKEIGELRTQLGERQDASKKVFDNQVDTSKVQLPDYSGMSEVTPDQLKKDIISAASQIVKLETSQIAGSLSDQINSSQAADRIVADEEYARSKYPQLDPAKPEYDETLSKHLGKTFRKAFDGDRNYRLKDLVDSTMDVLGSVSTNSASAADEATKKDAASGAIKTTPTARGSSKSIDKMTAEEYRKHIGQ